MRTVSCETLLTAAGQIKLDRHFSQIHMALVAPLRSVISRISKQAETINFNTVTGEYSIADDEQLQEFVRYTPSDQFTGDDTIAEITKTSMVIGDHFKLKIVHGDPGTLQIDTVVNVLGYTTDTTETMKWITELSNKSRDEIQSALDSVGFIERGQIKETDSLSLPCKKVLHCYLPPYKDILEAYNYVKDMVTDCINHASSRNKHKSICFPLLSLHYLGYPIEKVVEWMVEALVDRSRQQSDTFITHIKTVFVLIQKNKDFQQLCEKVERYMNSWRYQHVTQNHVLIYNKISFEIVCRSISEAKEKVVVNSTGVDVDLSESTGKAIAEVAGPEFRKACEQLRPLCPEWVKDTDAYDFKPCEKILHCNSPFYKNDFEYMALRGIIDKCLERANQLGYESLAIPAIGMRSKEYPSRIVALTIMNAVTEFCLHHRRAYSKKIRLYLQPAVISLPQLKDFQWMMKLLDSVWQDNHLVIAQRSQLTILKGSVADIEADVIVNLTSNDMDMENNKVSAAISCAAGPELRRVCRASLNEEQIAVTEGFKLPCSEVYHIVLPEWSSDSEEMLSHTISECLDTANGNQLTSIAFPAFRSDKHINPSAKVVWCMITTIVEYFRDPQRWSSLSLRKVYIACDSHDEELKSAFENVTQTALQPVKQLCNIRQQAIRLTQEENIHIEFPELWDKPTRYYEEFIVNPLSSEFRMVEESFLCTLNAAKAQILEIMRIQNATRYQMYEVLRKEVARRLSSRPVTDTCIERFPLWHGTKEKNVKEICMSKFDRARAGTNAGRKLGYGCYFATQSDICVQDKYSPPNDKSERFIILSRVVTGEYCLGKSSYKATPSSRDANLNKIKYDSVVDDMENPTVFCVFEDASAYPEYVIKYCLHTD